MKKQPDLKIVETFKINNAEVTPSAMMPKMFVCIEGEGARVFRGRQVVRVFKHFENGIKNLVKLRKIEAAKAEKFYKAVAKGGTLLMSPKAKIKVKWQEPENDGFEKII